MTVGSRTGSMSCLGLLLFMSIALPLSQSRAQQVNIALSPVANTGNAPDPLTGYGEVDYDYDIGTYDVTISQYCTFLNDVASYSDPYSLFNDGMIDMGNLSGVSGVAGITQTGSSGGYTYSIVNDSGNDPVTQVTWFDAARFSNWLQNGQPVITGSIGEIANTTETGAYMLLGDTSTGMETKSVNSTWWIPTENEWYKAAYYDPTLNGGSGGYWLTPMRSNGEPGNVVGDLPDQTNCYTGVYSVTQSAQYSSSQDYLTPVGSFTNSASYYGTYDQGGDVYEWDDATIGENRGIRSCYWDDATNAMVSEFRYSNPPTNGNYGLGFRVATLYSVPEPNSALFLIGVGLLGAPLVRRRFFIK